MPRIALLSLLVVLLGASVAAFVVTQDLKEQPSPVGVPRIEPRLIGPTCSCPTASTALRLRLRRADRVTARVVDAAGAPVRTLVEGRRYPRGPLELRWDGRADDGSVVPDGRYRVELVLARAGRTILVPTTIRVDSTPPQAAIVAVRPPAFSPDGDGERDKVRVVYRSSERAGAVLSVAAPSLPEAVAVRGRVRPAGRSQLVWRGHVAGEPLAPGSYVLVLRVRDLAGNVSAPARAPVTIEGAGG